MGYLTAGPLFVLKREREGKLLIRLCVVSSWILEKVWEQKTRQDKQGEKDKK